MKKEWIAVLLLAGVIALSVFSQHRLRALTEELCLQGDAAAEAARLEDWQRAEDACREALREWQAAGPYTHIFLRHGQIDDATGKLIALLGAAHAGDADGVFLAREALCSAMRELYAMERLSPGTVL